jgi:precorrin-2 dehydrogenase/sirohydrochlorin ferrochelatase
MKRFTTGEKTGMAYFPIMINLENRAVLIIGGGATALRKAETMLSYGAKVFVIAKEFKHEFPKAAVLKEKEFEDEDLLLKSRDYFLVIVATGDGEVNAHISEL